MIPYADPAALIDDPQVLRVAITDNGEPLIVVRTISALAALAVDQSRADVQQISENPFHVRAGVAEKLTRAQAALPDGYQLQVKEGWRRPGARTPGSSHGPASRPPHSTGGAVDVALVHDGRTAAPVTNAARRHRDILASAMDAAGSSTTPLNGGTGLTEIDTRPSRPVTAPPSTDPVYLSTACYLSTA